MNQTKRDLFNLFFRRDTLRERVYPTRVTYLVVAVIAMLGMTLLFVGAARFHESLGLTPLSSSTTVVSSLTQSTPTGIPTPTELLTAATVTVTARQSVATPAAQPPVTLLTPAPANNPVRCPITWHVQEVAKSGGGRIGLPDDNAVTTQVRQDFREAMQWADAPAQAWNLAEADRFYTPRMAGEVRAGLQLNLNRQECVQVERADLGTLSISFTPDGAGVTFMSVQYEPITQTIRDVGTLAVKRTVVLNDVPYRLVGIAMLYDTQDCRWKIDRIEYQEPQAQ